MSGFGQRWDNCTLIEPTFVPVGMMCTVHPCWSSITWSTLADICSETEHFKKRSSKCSNSLTMLPTHSQCHYHATAASTSCATSGAPKNRRCSPTETSSPRQPCPVRMHAVTDSEPNITKILQSSDLEDTPSNADCASRQQQRLHSSDHQAVRNSCYSHYGGWWGTMRWYPW